MERVETTYEPGVFDQEKVSAERLGGYHRCFLSEPIHLEYVSESFCTMLGYCKQELSDLVGGVYTALMHPDDTYTFSEFISRLSKREGCESVAYRLIKKDGTIIRVVDTMTSAIDQDGYMRGYSVVSQVRDEQTAPQPAPPSEKMAIIKVSGNSGAEIVQMSGAATSLLAVDEDVCELRFIDFVAMNDRPKITHAIATAYDAGCSKMEKCTIVSANGEATECNLWVARVAQNDSLESSVFCIKVVVDLEYQQESEEALSFSKMLFSSFTEDVFEVDRQERSVRFICHNSDDPIVTLLNVRMFADDLLDAFLERVHPDQRERAKEFCLRARSWMPEMDRESPVKIGFSFSNRDGSYRPATLTMIPVSSAKYFMCLSPDANAASIDAFSGGAETKKRVTIRLFDSFALFVDGRAVHIRHDKARELLALLTVKRGAFLTNHEAISELWECEPDDRSRARYRKTASRLMAELRKYDIDGIVETDRGARRIVAESIECDYYDFRDGKISLPGALLPEYPWAEFIRLE